MFPRPWDSTATPTPDHLLCSSFSQDVALARWNQVTWRTFLSVLLKALSDTQCCTKHRLKSSRSQRTPGVATDMDSQRDCTERSKHTESFNYLLRIFFFSSSIYVVLRFHLMKWCWEPSTYQLTREDHKSYKENSDHFICWSCSSCWTSCKSKSVLKTRALVASQSYSASERQGPL